VVSKVGLASAVRSFFTWGNLICTHKNSRSAVKRSETVDVLWFNQRLMPNSLFEVEHSTDIQNSLLKFQDLQDFYTRMIIVADGNRRAEFEQKMDRKPFDEIRDRVKFLDYDTLVKQYEHEVFKSNRAFVI